MTLYFYYISYIPPKINVRTPGKEKQYDILLADGVILIQGDPSGYHVLQKTQILKKKLKIQGHQSN